MRLIDKDGLLEKLSTFHPDYTFNITAFRNFVNAQPEVEKKKGKWVLTEDDNYEYCTCSECGYQNGENWMNGSDIPFCAMCGADMRGDEDG